MMNVLIVFAHPEEKSFNGILKDFAVETLQNLGHHVIVSDLYQMGFKAVADRNDFTKLACPEHFRYLYEQKHAVEHGTFTKDIIDEQNKIKWADYIIFQFPLWWTEPPAILKGWFDRVFAKGFAYDNGATYENGLLKGKKAMLSFTTAGGPELYGKHRLKGEMHERLFNLHHEKLFYCGLSILEPFISWSIIGSDLTARDKYLQEYKKRLFNLTQMPTLSIKEPFLDESLAY